MSSGRLLPVVFAVVAALSASYSPAAESADRSALPARSSDADGVSVTVRPRAPTTTTWDFEVVMNTHTKPLNDDLVGVAVLIDGSGRRLGPLAWQGDPPGGHHRKGVLQFSVDAEKTKSIELDIAGVGGTPKRVFQWQIN